MKCHVIKTSIALFVAPLIFAAGARAQSGTAARADASRERAVALWEEAIRAKGGRERLRTVENFLITSTVDVRAKRGSAVTETERLYTAPGRAWIFKYTEAYDVSVEAIVINPLRVLCTVTLSPAGRSGSVPPLSYCAPTTPTEYLAQDPAIYLMETSWLRPVPVRARTEGKGDKQVDVVETEVRGLRLDFYLHRKTRLPFKVVTDQFYGVPQATDKMGLTVHLEKYEAVDGIQMPRRVTREPSVIESTLEVFRRDTENARYSFNVTFDETIFERPIPKNVKRGDWKAR
ncbi:MAG TPA: hypothetical protein VD861_06835 [Pyrinomonadaceae bacterium]|nr:hypothetical protein [Pyrinomonadaceae bacterium]